MLLFTSGLICEALVLLNIVALHPISIRTGNHLRLENHYITSQPVQPSPSILPWVGRVSTRNSWGATRHTVWRRICALV